MFCATCESILKDPPLSRRPCTSVRGFSDFNRPHHPSVASFQEAIESKCRICLRLQLKLKSRTRRVLFQDDGKLAEGVDEASFKMACRIGCETPTNTVLSFHVLVQAKKEGKMQSTSGIFFMYLAPEQRLIAEIDPPLQDHTNNPANLQLISSWIVNCNNNHPQCQRTKLPSKTYSRIINVGRTKHSATVRLCSSFDTSSNPPYTTLSHCWGGANIPSLTRSNHAQYSEAISLSDLPQTFCDAIKITRELGVEYLWIDSLCIIQDSHDDWLDQSSVMGQIYSGSFCNLAATRSSDPFGGLFATREPALISPLCVSIRMSNETDTFYDVSEDFEKLWADQVGHSALAKRAWVVQERLLAPRTVHFASSELLWECVELQTREADARAGTRQRSQRSTWSKFKAWDPYAMPLVAQTSEPIELSVNYIWSASKAMFGPRPFDLTKDLLAADPNALAKAKIACFGQDSWTASHPLLLYWARILEKTYCNANLTRMTDRLQAISGLAKLLSERTGIRYVAGVWLHQLPRQLLWTVTSRVKHDTTHKDYIAPSWSWASGPIGIFWNMTLESKLEVKGAMALIKILTVQVQGARDEEYPMDELKSARLRVRGRLIPFECDWSKWPEPEERDKHIVKYINPSTTDPPRRETFLAPVLFIRSSTRLPKPVPNALILEATEEKGTFRRIGTARLSNHYPLGFAVPHLYASKSGDHEDSDDDATSDEGEEPEENKTEQDVEGTLNDQLRALEHEDDAKEVPQLGLREEFRTQQLGRLQNIQNLPQWRALIKHANASDQRAGSGNQRAEALTRVANKISSLSAMSGRQPSGERRITLDANAKRDIAESLRENWAAKVPGEVPPNVKVVQRRNMKTYGEVVKREPQKAVGPFFYKEVSEDDETPRYGCFVYDII